MKYNDPTGHCALSAAMGPPGLTFDIPCWTTGAGAVTVAAAAGAVASAVAGQAVMNYVINEPPLNYPPLYPNAGIGNGNISVTIPVPSSTTVTSGVPLASDNQAALAGVTPVNSPAQQIVEPLPQAKPLDNIVLNKTLQTGGHTLNNQTLKELGFTKEQGKQAIEALKRDLRLPNNFHQKIMRNGDFVDAHTGEVLGNLYDYLP